MLSEEMIDKYRAIYKKRYGEEISRQEALAQGTALLNMMKVIYRPLPKTGTEGNKKP